MESGWDPGVKKFFVKILNSVAMGLLWMMTAATTGLYFGLAYGRPLIYTLLYYIGLVVSLFFLVRYFYKTWKDGPD